MSTWIHITNLPLYYDDYGLQDIFSDIGQITATNVTKNNMIMKSTGFVQFANTKHAKLAASKKDQTVIANSAVRVYLLWTEKEDLSTIKVKNIEPQSTENDLEKYFDPYGGIVDIRIINNNQNAANNDDQKNKEINDKSKEDNELYALISFCRVDYALQAVQEMNGTIIGMGGALSVELVNPDARNLKWKRNSFEYILMPIPTINTMNQYHHNHHNHHKHRHRHHRHNHHNHHDRRNHHNNGYNQQYSSNDNNPHNPNIIIVNNIGSIHNNTTINDDDSKNNQLLHPTYRSQGGNRNDSHYRRHQNFNGDKQHHRPHSHSPNTTTTRGRGRSNNDRRYRQHHDNNDHRHRRHNNDHNDRNRHQRHDDKARDRRARKYRSARSNQSTLLGPLHNFSNGQYRTYSVTPSPTRSDTTSSSNDSRHNSGNPGLPRMNSADSTSSNGSTHSQPAYGHAPHYHQKHGHKRRALDHYGLHNNSTKSHHHSPQPFNPQQIVTMQQQQQTTPVSPATTVSTPSTTHSMPTPTGYTANTRSMMSRSKTPTALSIPLTTPTILSNSTTTPVSTPPSTQALKYGATNPVFRPQTSLPLNALNPNVLHNAQMNNLNHMNNMNNINNINMMMNGMTLGINPMNGMVSPTALSLPLQNMNIPTPTNATIPNTQPMAPAKSPQAQVTSPIVITPQHNFLLQQQLGGIPQCNAPNAKTTPIVISPPNTQQPFTFGSPTLLGPLNTPPEPQKKFTFNGTNNNTLSPASNNSVSSSSSSKKTKKSPSHSWTKEQEELGNKLYKIVASVYPDRATKIVGMLLTGHNAEDLKFMVNRPNILMPLAKDYNEKQMAKDAKKEMNK